MHTPSSRYWIGDVRSTELLPSTFPTRETQRQFGRRAARQLDKRKCRPTWQFVWRRLEPTADPPSNVASVSGGLLRYYSRKLKAVSSRCFIWLAPDELRLVEALASGRLAPGGDASSP